MAIFIGCQIFDIPQIDRISAVLLLLLKWLIFVRLTSFNLNLKFLMHSLF